MTLASDTSINRATLYAQRNPDVRPADLARDFAIPIQDAQRAIMAARRGR